MNPYPERIAELHDFLAARFGVKDTEATEVLLACLLDHKVTGAAKPWIVVETDWMSRQMTGAWFDFGGLTCAQSLAVARTERHGPMDQMINAWLETRALGASGIFMDAEWRSLAHLVVKAPRHTAMGSAYGRLMAGCIRLRTEYPKTAWAVEPADVKTRDLQKLRLLAARVLDPALRAQVSQIKGAAALPPTGMFYWCELLQKISYVARDWDTLIWSLVQIVRNVCTLYNQPYRAPEWRTAERLVRDSVNWATGEIVRKAHERARIRPEDEQYNPQSRPTAWAKEMTRLCRAGVLQYRGGRKTDKTKWNRLGSGDWWTLVDRDQRMFT